MFQDSSPTGAPEKPTAAAASEKISTVCNEIKARFLQAD